MRRLSASETGALTSPPVAGYEGVRACSIASRRASRVYAERDESAPGDPGALGQREQRVSVVVRVRRGLDRALVHHRGAQQLGGRPSEARTLAVRASRSISSARSMCSVPM